MPGLVVASKGFPGRICQWSNTHCGKAWPPVLERRSAVKPENRNRYLIQACERKYEEKANVMLNK